MYYFDVLPLWLNKRLFRIRVELLRFRQFSNRVLYFFWQKFAFAFARVRPIGIQVLGNLNISDTFKTEALHCI